MVSAKSKKVRTIKFKVDGKEVAADGKTFQDAARAYFDGSIKGNQTHNLMHNRIHYTASLSDTGRVSVQKKPKSSAAHVEESSHSASTGSTQSSTGSKSRGRKKRLSAGKGFDFSVTNRKGVKTNVSSEGHNIKTAIRNYYKSRMSTLGSHTVHHDGSNYAVGLTKAGDRVSVRKIAA